ncbi:MAG: redoxin domain-containing protein [Anaerolineae bacterium]
MKENNADSAPDMRKILLFISGIGILGLAAFFLLFGGLTSSTSDSPVANIQITPIPEDFVKSNPIEPELDGAVQVGEIAPNFTLIDLDGNEHTLDSLRGKPVIVNFWATWCAPCRIEMPEFEEAFVDYADENLVILALNREETPDVVEEFFIEEMGLTFTPLLDSTAQVADGYGVFNMPTTYFINAEGVVSDVHRGPVARVQLDQYLENVLN